MGLHRTHHLSRRGGVYYFRKATPYEVRPRIGYRELKISLRTREPKCARQRCQKVTGIVDVLLEEVQRMPELSDEAVSALARSELEGQLAAICKGADSAAKEGPDEMKFQQIASEEHTNDLKRQLKFREFEKAIVEAAKFGAEKMGVTPEDLNQEQLHLICAAVARAWCERNRLYERLIQGDFAGAIPQDPLFKGIALPLSPKAAGDISIAKYHSLKSIIDRYIDTKSKTDWVAKTRADNKRALDRFANLIGPETSLKSITKDHARTYRDALLQLIATPYVVNKKENDSQQETISNTTARKYFGFIKSFFRWCVEEGWLDADPVGSLKVSKAKSAEVKRLPFSKDELSEFLNSPQFTGHCSAIHRAKPGKLLIKDGKYWIPLVALFTGMRLGEIVQLDTTDVRTDGDITYFDVNKLETDTSSLGKKLKTPAAVRKIPIHISLEKLGFLKYVEGNRKKGTLVRLFPEIGIGADGHPSHNFSKWFGRYLKSIGLKTKYLTFHSFRHNFADALDAVHATQAAKRTLMGHAEKHVEGQYGAGVGLETLAEVINTINYKVNLPD